MAITTSDGNPQELESDAATNIVSRFIPF